MDEKLKRKIGENVDSIWVSVGINPNINKDDKYERINFQAGISINKDIDFNKDEMFEYAWEMVKNEVNKEILDAQKKYLEKKEKNNHNKKQNGTKPASQAQLNMIEKLREQRGVKDKPFPKTTQEASDEIQNLQKIEKKEEAKF